MDEGMLRLLGLVVAVTTWVICMHRLIARNRRRLATIPGPRDNYELFPYAWFNAWEWAQVILFAVACLTTIIWLVEI